MIEAHLSTPGARAPEGYAVAREDPADENRADLGWTSDPRDPDRLLFVTPRCYPVRHNLFYKRVFKPAVRSALPPRLHGLRFHGLRHTAAALSLAASPNLHVVKERLGHENIATTVDLYGKRVPSVDAAIADAVGASIFDAPARRRSRSAGRTADRARALASIRKRSRSARLFVRPCGNDENPAFIGSGASASRPGKHRERSHGRTRHARMTRARRS